MKDFFEESVAKKDQSINTILYRLFNSGIWVFGALAMMSLFSLQSNRSKMVTIIILTVVLAGIAYIFYLLRDRQIIEFDYTLSGSQLQISKIINNKKRKEIFNDDAQNFSYLGQVDDVRYQQFLKETSVLNASLNRSVTRHYIITNHGDTKVMLILEPSEELWDRLNSLGKFARRGV